MTNKKVWVYFDILFIGKETPCNYRQLVSVGISDTTTDYDVYREASNKLLSEFLRKEKTFFFSCSQKEKNKGLLYAINIANVCSVKIQKVKEAEAEAE